MLNRNAEALFWIGRYMERAENHARLIDVHYHLQSEELQVQPTGEARTKEQRCANGAESLTRSAAARLMSSNMALPIRSRMSFITLHWTVTTRTRSSLV